MSQFHDGPEFRQGGNVAHQQENKIKVDSLPIEAEKELNQLQTQLNVDEDYEEAFEIARRLLKFYHFENAIRNGQCFAAAALYFGFRCKNAPYLLIEISSLIGNDTATKIAKCYLKLLKFVRMDVKSPQLLQLSQNLQYLDPSIYIPKFVRALDLHDKHEVIVETAIKLIKRMMLDWMAYGRRPSSLCGAALLISARFHGENVQTSKICQIVQVCDETIRKRLAEFNQTGLSQLTREQFEQIQNIETDVPGKISDPPSFKRLKEKEEEIKKGLTEDQYQQLQDSTLKKAMEMIELLKSKPEIYKDEYLVEQQISPKLKSEEIVNQISEELSSLSEQDEQEYILTPSDRAYKQVVWQNMYKEYISDRDKRNAKKQKEILKNQGLIKKPTEDKKKKVKIEYQCSTPLDSLKKTFENDHINSKALEELFVKQEKKEEGDLLASALKGIIQ